MTTQTPEVNQTLIYGRITATRRHEQHFYTEVTTPAPDAYTQPGICEIRSERSIGKKGEDVQQLCRISGYKGKPFQVVDRSTGETETRRSVLTVLIAIEE